MRMINYGKTFRIQSEDPMEAKVIFALGQSVFTPRASGMTMDNGQAIDFMKDEACLFKDCHNFIASNFTSFDAWNFSTLCGAALRGDEEAFAGH